MKSHDQILVHLNLILFLHLFIFQLGIFCRLFTVVLLSSGYRFIEQITFSLFLLNFLPFFVDLHLLILVVGDTEVILVLNSRLGDVVLLLLFLDLGLLFLRVIKFLFEDVDSHLELVHLRKMAVSLNLTILELFLLRF